MIYTQVYANLATIIARKILKTSEIKRGPRGGYYIINEHKKKIYFKPDEFKKRLVSIAKRDPYEIASAVMKGMESYNNLSKKQKKGVTDIANSAFDNIMKDPDALDALDKAAEALTPEQQKKALATGIGKAVLEKSKAGKSLSVKTSNNSGKSKSKSGGSGSSTSSNLPATTSNGQGNAPANTSNSTPANNSNNVLTSQDDDEEDILDTNAEDVTEKETPSTGILHGVANMLMKATLVGLAAASFMLGTDDFTLEDVKRHKSYVNVIHDQFADMHQRNKKRINSLIPDSHKKLDESVTHWANDDDLSFFNMDRHDRVRGHNS